MTDCIYVVGKSRHPWLCRWWLRTKPIEFVEHKPGWLIGGAELYVPWWAWPLELMHRVIFGHPRLQAIRRDAETIAAASKAIDEKGAQ